MDRYKIWGPPGTGKTTTLLKTIKKDIDTRGTAEGMVVTTFRRDVAQELREKIAILAGEDPRKLGNINTIHGLCLREIVNNPGCFDPKLEKNIGNHDAIIGPHDLREFSDITGFDVAIDSTDPEDGEIGGDVKHLLNFYTWMKNTGTTIDECYEYPHFHSMGMSTEFLKEFCDQYDEFKKENGKIDFSDMISLCNEAGLTPAGDILIVDEFQDLTKQQYDIFTMWADSFESVIIAGDPLQSIYPFWGGSPEYFQQWDAEEQILDKSFRMPKRIWETAKNTLYYQSGQEAPEVETKEASGDIERIDHMDLAYYMQLHYERSGGKTFHLVRANYQAINIAFRLAELGVPFSGLCGWSEIEILGVNALTKIRNWRPFNKEELKALVELYPLSFFNRFETKKTDLKKEIDSGRVKLDFSVLTPEFLNIVMNGDPVTGMERKGELKACKMRNMLSRNTILEPDDFKTTIKTIHGAKGLEAETVFLHTGITKKISTGILDQVTAEDEARVWYVGISRTAEKLVIVEDKGKKYDIYE